MWSCPVGIYISGIEYLGVKKKCGVISNDLDYDPMYPAVQIMAFSIIFFIWVPFYLVDQNIYSTNNEIKRYVSQKTTDPLLA